MDPGRNLERRSSVGQPDITVDSVGRLSNRRIHAPIIALRLKRVSHVS